MPVMDDLDTTSLEDLEDEFDIPCDVPKMRAMSNNWAGPNCKGDPARWIGRRRCCGAVTLLCDECKLEYLYRAQQALLHSCVLCDNDHSGYGSFEPLKRTA